jgi:hypothetical protein
MTPLGRQSDHLRLATRMARTVGCDLARAQESGALAQDDWAEMILTCRGCGWAADCTRWLDRTETAPVAPPRCLNRAGFAALSRNGA